jgi:hypothetical protein
MSVKQEWGIACPNCGLDSHIRISIAAEITLSVEGSEVIGDHEWGHDSRCRCTACGWSGKVEQASEDAR